MRLSMNWTHAYFVIHVADSQPVESQVTGVPENLSYSHGWVFLAELGTRDNLTPFQGQQTENIVNPRRGETGPPLYASGQQKIIIIKLSPFTILLNIVSKPQN